MGLMTLVYTLFGGLKAVVWADVLQLAVYIAGGVARSSSPWSSPAGRAWHSPAPRRRASSG